MLKTLFRLSWIALLLAGCIKFKSVSGSVGSDGSASTNSNGTATPLPTMQLQFAGTSFEGLRSDFFWETPDGKTALGSQPMYGGESLVTDLSYYPSTLVAQVGQSVDIVVTSVEIPITLIVTEYDTQGIAITSSVLRPTASRTPYELVTKGQYIMQITAQWSSKNFMTFLFEADITP